MNYTYIYQLLLKNKTNYNIQWHNREDECFP